MATTLRYCLLLFICSCLSEPGYAGSIDSISTKEDALKFLKANFSKEGFIFLINCADLYQSPRYKMNFANYISHPDSIPVENPVTGEKSIKVMWRDPASYNVREIDSFPSNYSYDEAAKTLDQNPFHFYKLDIDHNKKTDLIVDAGIVIVVVDMAGRYEGHLFSSVPDSSCFRLSGLVPLPDSTTGLLFNYGCCQSDASVMVLHRRTDTLVYKFQGFTQYNPHVDPKSISKISYRCLKSTGLMSSDGATVIEINKDGRCYLRYSQYDTVFAGVLDRQSITELWKEVAYADLKSKKNAYFDMVDHAIGGDFVIYFDDGTVKTVSVWACSPPIGLAYLSKHIGKLSRLIHWQQCTECIDLKYSNWPPLMDESTFDGGCDCRY